MTVAPTPPLRALGLMVGAGILAGASAFWASATHGIGVWPDSVTYLSAADNLRAGRGYVDYRGDAFGDFPPAYSVLLAAVALLGRTDAHEAARWVSAASFGGIVILIGVAAWRLTRSVGLALASCVLAAVAGPLPKLSVVAWSEPPSIVWTLICLIALSLMLTTDAAGASASRWAWFGTAAAAAACACLTRYPGVAVVVAGAGAIASSGAHRRRRIGLALLFSVVSLAPMLLWIARNKALTGHMAGPRHRSAFTLRDNLRKTTQTVGSWHLPESLNPTPRQSAMAMAVFVGACLWLRSRRKRAGTTADSERDAGSHLLRAIGWYAGAFAAFMVAAASTVAFDSLGGRLLAPLYPATLLLVVAAAKSALDAWPQGVAAVTVGVYVAVMAVSGGVSAVHDLADHRMLGSGYSSAVSEVPGLLDAIRAEQGTDEVALFSNMPPRLWWTCRLVAGNAPAVLATANTTEAVPLSERYAGFEAERRRGRRILLVWYHASKPWYARPDDIRREYGDAAPLWLSQGCTLYEVRRFGSPG